MKKYIILYSVLFLMVNCEAMEQPKTDQQGKSITHFIMKAIGKHKAEKWCLLYRGGKVCDAYFKEAVLGPLQDGTETYSLHWNTEDAPAGIDEMLSFIHLKEKMLSFYPIFSVKKKLDDISTSIWIKGEEEIKKLGNKFGDKTISEAPYEDAMRKSLEEVSDKYTVCERVSWKDKDNIPTVCYSCKTRMPYEEFVKKVSGEKKQ